MWEYADMCKHNNKLNNDKFGYNDNQGRGYGNRGNFQGGRGGYGRGNDMRLSYSDLKHDAEKAE